MNEKNESEVHLPVETHPWPPFVPEGARVLMMGTFPPAPKRWSMDFYYPNPTNDFWRIAGLVFLGDAAALYDTGRKCFRLDDVRALMAAHHVALQIPAAAYAACRAMLPTSISKWWSLWILHLLWDVCPIAAT